MERRDFLAACGAAGAWMATQCAHAALPVPMLDFEGRRALPLSPVLVFRDGRRVVMPLVRRDHLGNVARAAFRVDAGEVELLFAPLAGREGWALGSRVRLASALAASAARLDLIHADLAGHRFTTVFHGRREPSLLGGLRLLDARDRAPDDGTSAAETVLALGGPGEPVLFVAAEVPASHEPSMAFRAGRLRVGFPLEPAHFGPAGWTSPRLLLRWNAPLLDSLSWLGTHSRRRAGGPRPAQVTWSTSAWMDGGESQRDVMTMLRQVREHPLLGPRVQCVMLDGKWASADDASVGNPRFPALSDLANAIHDAGYVPGIRYAPFLDSGVSSFHKRKPDAFLTGEGPGTADAPPVGLLDPTHPAVRTKIFEDLRTLREAGFAAFHTDGLAAPFAAYRWAKPSENEATLVDAMRASLTSVRAAIGAESMWMASQVPITAAAGLPDVVRVADGLRPLFSRVMTAAAQAATAVWTNGTLWRAEPDRLLVRGRETEAQSRARDAGAPPGRPPYVRLSRDGEDALGLEDARTWATFQIVFGGALTIGDPPSTLNERGHSLIAKVLEHASPDTPGVPLDLDEHPLPERWVRPASDGWLVALFNWGDAERTIELAARDTRWIGDARLAADLWSGKVQSIRAGRLAAKVPAHGAAIFKVS